MTSIAEILLATPNAFAIAYDVADCIDGQGFHLRDSANWREAMAFVRGYGRGGICEAIAALPPEQHPLLVVKVRRILENRRAERRRERWADAWARFRPCVFAIATFAVVFALMSAAQLIGWLLFGPQP